MKKLLILITASVFVFFGTSVETQAQCRPQYGYQAPASTIYISGYQNGRPVYVEKYLVGYDRRGRPVYRYRSIQPRGGYVTNSHHHCKPAYPSRYSSGHYSSGTRVTISFGR